MPAKKTTVKKKISTQDYVRKKMQSGLDYILGSDNLRSKGAELNNYLRGTPKKKIVKKKPTTTVDNSYTSGETVKFVDPKTGLTHVKNTAGGKVTYHKYDKNKKFVGGYTENTFAFGAKDGGKKIPISADGYKKKTVAEKVKKEFIPNKPTPGQNVAELWKKTTGTSWSEAKKQGLTDGSAKSNLALMSKLKSGTYKPEAKVEPKVKVEPKPFVPASFPARTDGPIADSEKLNEMRRGGRVMATKKPKMAMGGTKKIVFKKPIKKRIVTKKK